MMSRRPALLLIVILLVLTPLALRHPLSAKEDAPKESPASPFTGKVLVIFTNEATDSGSYVLEEARLKIIGNRQFLVGKSASTGDGDWTRELPLSIKWDAIVSVIEFESIEQYKERSSDADLRAGL